MVNVVLLPQRQKRKFSLWLSNIVSVTHTAETHYMSDVLIMVGGQTNTTDMYSSCINVA